MSQVDEALRKAGGEDNFEDSLIEALHRLEEVGVENFPETVSIEVNSRAFLSFIIQARQLVEASAALTADEYPDDVDDIYAGAQIFNDYAGGLAKSLALEGVRVAVSNAG